MTMNTQFRSCALAAGLMVSLLGLPAVVQAQGRDATGFSGANATLGAVSAVSGSLINGSATSFSALAGADSGSNTSSIFDLTVDALPGQVLTTASLTLSGTYELPVGPLAAGEGVFVRGQYYGGGLVGTFGASPMSFASGVWSYTTPLVALAGGTTSITFSTGLFAALSQTPGLARISLSTASLNVSAVPEPETYALMLSGLVAVFFMASRRRNEG